MTVTTLSVNAEEESCYVITGTITDLDGSDVLDDDVVSINWTLTTERGEVVNSLLNQAITPATASFSIYLSGADLALNVNNRYSKKRIVTVTVSFNSNVGGTNPKTLNGECSFDIDNFTNI